MKVKLFVNRAIFTISIFAFFSCSQQQPASHAFGDTVIRKYLSLVDTAGKFDTTDMNFKALSAYYRKDTAYLKELNHYIDEQYAGRPNWDLWQTDIPLPPIKQLQVEVGFRFVFSVFGSPVYEAITITQVDTIRTLHYKRYRRDKDSSVFHTYAEFKKTIREEDWREVAAKLLYADFWGIKSESDYRGDDGNDLTVFGYQKFDDRERYHVVHRWRNTNLHDAFYYLYYRLLSNQERLFSTK